MNYLQLVNYIKGIALKQPNVNTFVRDFDRLNTEDICYSAVVLQDTTHTRNEDMMIFNFYLGYVDRWNGDKSNTDYNWNEGINVLNNILNVLNNDYNIAEATLSTFTPLSQKFIAECDVVYATLTVNMPVTGCAEEFERGDFNKDYNNDFDTTD